VGPGCRSFVISGPNTRRAHHVSNKIRTKSFKDKLKAAKLPQNTLSVCLRGDLFAPIQALANQLAEIQQQEDDTDRFIKNPDAKRISDEIEALRTEMREGTEDFVVHAMSKDKWNELRARHKPRDNEVRDIHTGVNIDTFNAELLPATVIEPVMDDQDWADLIDVMSDKQYEDLVDACWAINRSEVNVPFSQAASTIRKSGSESKPPND